MASDFKDLFGEDWHPQDFEGGSSEKRPDGEDARSHSAAPLELPEGSELRGSEFTSENENRNPRALNEKEVRVVGVYMQQEPGLQAQHFVLLRDNKGRRVPIWVGQFEAWAISYAIDNEVAERPLTHDLMKGMLERLGATVDRIIIDDLWSDTFYAKITLVSPDGEYIDIDARPSDAVALALRVHAPIYMAEYVLEATVHKD